MNYLNILIADDHPLTLMGTKAYVESLGYRDENIQKTIPKSPSS